jgi:ABC-type phosphate/phosphonate transport system substrate-binding protein
VVVGYSAGILAEVDSRDAQAATKIWTDMIIRRKGYDIKSEALIFQDVASLWTAVEKESVDLLFLLPQEFLDLHESHPVIPIAISTPSKGLFVQFALMVRADSGISDIQGLRNKRLMIETDQRGTLPIVWLETLLMRAGESNDPKKFFSTIQVTRKASQTVMPVFFGKADGCVVMQSAFETMEELNPQLGARLRVIASSPGYVAAVGCLRQAYYRKHPSFFAENLETLHEDPQGEQILTLFRKEKLLPFKASYLNSVKALLREHDELQEKLAGKR